MGDVITRFKLETTQYDSKLRDSAKRLSELTERLQLAGKDFNKWEQMGLTPAPAAVVNAPVIEEAPVSIECRVKQIIPLGTHDMFIAEVVNVMVDEQYLDEKGKFDMVRAGLMAYSHGEYFTLGKSLGHFGWSVRKKKKK